jgi:hypothetical protein
MGVTGAIVSFVPLMNTSLPWRRVELTPCDARTRSFRPLGGFLGLLLPPQERKLRAAHTPTAQTRMRLFKREAPNNMKKEDLVAKWWIITDPVPLLMDDDGEQIQTIELFLARIEHPLRCANQS